MMDGEKLDVLIWDLKKATTHLSRDETFEAFSRLWRVLYELCGYHVEKWEAEDPVALGDRNFKKLLFLGSGQRSVHEEIKLVYLLARSLMLNSGLQQGGYSENDPQVLQHEIEIESAAQDIFTALTGSDPWEK